MQAFADRAAIVETMETGLATFYSRSRKGRWCKGETSGHFIRVHSVLVDCDADSVIYVSSAHGPACHTGAQSCYYRLLGGGEGAGEQDVNASLPALVALNRTVLARASEPAGGGKPSWTAKLLRDPELNCRKVREEADELCRTWEDAEGPERAASEAADLIYHALVLLRTQVVVVSLESRGLSVDWEDDSKALQCSLFFPAKVFHDLKVQVRQQMATSYGRLLDAALLLSASSGAAIKLEYPGPEGSLVVSQAQVHVGLAVPLLHSSLAPLSAPQPSPLSDLWTEPSCAFVCPGHLLREALEDLEALAAPIRLELRGEAEGVSLEARAPEARAGVELPRSVLRAWEGAERAPAHEYRARHLQLAL
ncbi:hypothetical protein H632_c30p0, partial [Helicosporidium sp. ATCC 50920]